MKKATEAQIDVVTALPFESHEWDVFVGMHYAIVDIQVSCVNREMVPISVKISVVSWSVADGCNQRTM